MFFDFGAGEVIGLALLAMILLGPDKLPQFAVDAAKMVKKIKNFASTATSELKENLGPGFEDLQPSDLHPKTFIKKQLANALEEDSNPKKLKTKAQIDPDLL
ncbi:TatA Sec-independent protein secretion pathway components [Candidatus Planktophila versatilis]|jgi:sec-independent protein translocase protein TatB|uniref:Sec-independent protein translocase protein TatB n=1 Tax=Candidatus Planktophila versatilis TaxID=1884905 RepID=A0AAC9YXU3_9ACTN|nr:sec-independent translocase [Candidatus Planktophila versatilis]ASY17558.1 sec-independent protein translocase protein TatB [Candidatus Planktophila versatilis]ASY18878.1 sec-independent protein translocase protein TatB [Candidatus Planktophila versatilis]ASY22894.1 sec-independent protein translocase protein TatB [Candidatus Planktophila versatilis]ASY26684.1 sec-independent protein translocase protein TatB [Candidatus Planktophila versatilis]